ncbi:ATP-grasp domain-containing protein [Bacillus sp. DTU_2020_1000418_1_SI_GHA_SEK_038]|uniref:ATP-grasp domain-containing protein n=1 Tax=Bacillus sp. DTU_2020_1000418_1_SI_GHA_SEK_038 TaxID=3077585 RepID=UPI0028E60D9D|nr:ATP-grasp domain-containing protein [Bacillus sp. DTU_2020_1000418_1_SI_GHA_SEK_038]WNS75843.1 ATP-grasp domain-containing protein [Bacillus sp. DTU_2020_1000418_1_SI_GHA_SEK_038]
MKTIVFIGCQQFGTSKEALAVARDMGYCVILFTEKKKQINPTAFPEVNHFVYLRDLFNFKKVQEEIEAFQQIGKEICACVSFIDPYISYTAELAKNLGLIELSIDALSIMENKINVKDTLKEHPSSSFYAVFHPDSSIHTFIEEHQAFLPLILKSPTSNGSKDVYLAETLEELESGLKWLQKKELPILVEEYLLGPQYLIEVLVHKGKAEIAGIIEQEFSEENPFIIIGYKFPALIEDEMHSKLINSVVEIIDQIGLKDGACHLEMRYVQGLWKLVEINPRMSGGTMNRIFEEGTGINLVKEILKMNLGKQFSLIPTRHQHVYAKYLTIGTSGRLLEVTGEELAWQYEGVKYVYVKPMMGKIVTVPYSMGNRYACVIAASESPESAKETAIAAAQELKFYLEPF